MAETYCPFLLIRRNVFNIWVCILEHALLISNSIEFWHDVGTIGYERHEILCHKRNENQQSSIYDQA